MRIATSSRSCTALSVSSKGTYQYVRMANGLCNASSTLCELIQAVIRYDLEPYVFPYMDDFLILMPTFEKHMEILAKLARRLNSANLMISVHKSRFCMKRTTYVGYVIPEDGIEANPERMKEVSDYPPPKNIKAVRRFIGMAGWYRRISPDYATCFALITNLLKNRILNSNGQQKHKSHSKR